MKKKPGFTLAEVLITLAVIGVVAALAAPALIGTFQNAKIGPALRKFKNTIEVANEHVLGENDSNTITGAFSTTDEYFTALKKYVTGTLDGTIADASPAVADYFGGKYTIASASDTKVYTLSSGAAFAYRLAAKVSNAGGSAMVSAKPLVEQPNGSYKGNVGIMYYDINGFNTKPNRLGKDIFAFVLDDSGVLIPYGGNQHESAYTSSLAGNLVAVNVANTCSKTSIGTGIGCAGSIADNGWKVIYGSAAKSTLKLEEGTVHGRS